MNSYIFFTIVTKYLLWEYIPYMNSQIAKFYVTIKLIIADDMKQQKSQNS